MDADVRRVAPDQVRAGEIRILVGVVQHFAIGSNAGQRELAEVPVALQRHTIIVDIVGRQEIGADLVVERRVGIEPDTAGERIDDRTGRPVDQVDDAAAILVDLVVIADQAELQVGARLPQQLGTEAVTVAVVDILVERGVANIAVAAVVVARNRIAKRVGQRAGQITLDDDFVVIAIGNFGRTLGLVERGLGGDDADDTRRRVFAEQRRLRPAQHLDALNIGQIADLRRRARAIDAVDEHADRWLDARVVRAITKAANDEVSVGR